MSISIYWFRNDLRLLDNPALAAACAASDQLVLVYVRSSDENALTAWDFPRWAVHRRAFRDQALAGLRVEIARNGGALHVVDGQPAQAISALASQIGADCVYCESIAAPEEIAEVAALRAAGLKVFEHWQSSLLDPADLPFAINDLPEVFTAFRHTVERADISPRLAVAAPLNFGGVAALDAPLSSPIATPDHRAAFPFGDPDFHGSEAAALEHVKRYFGSPAPQTYKLTRNGLIGAGYSTKFSPWLAVGALSPRTVFANLKAHEAQFGANDSTYWIWFELLWRDFFRFWSLKHGVRLFGARGLGRHPLARHDPLAFAKWCAGETGHPFIDAGMRELAATGYLSNRMRQVVASYLVHDLGGDWRAGAAWFEAQLIDYDVCSNQGNWLYIAGRGADPRQGRRFNPDKQAADYDASGAYRELWASAA